MFPPSTNADYHGSIVAVWGLGLIAILTIIPGAIHAFTPDGGLVSIAGLDISANPHLLISTSAWLGATQIPWGILLLAVAVRYRGLVPLALLLVFVQVFINGSNQWVFRPAPEGSHIPPEKYGVLVMVPVTLALLWISLPQKGKTYAG